MTPTTTTFKRWTAAELRRLHAHEREVVLRAAAEQAEAEYRANSELTAFEAFGEDDLHVDSASTESGEVWMVDFGKPFRAQVGRGYCGSA